MTDGADRPQGAARPLREPTGDRLSLLLWAAGAVIGLAAAGYALFTARGTATNTVPPEYIATVNQRPIYLSDYLDLLQSQFNVTMETASREQRRKVLDDMIREELFVQRGLELDEPANDPDVRNALVAAVQAQIAVDATTQVPSEAELLAFYRQNLQRYSSIGYLTAADLIAVADPASDKAAASLAVAAAALRAGKPLDAVKAQFGVRESGLIAGEQVYFAAQLHLGDKLFEVARALGKGEVSPPVQAEDGRYHVLYMSANQPPQPRDFTMARSAVYGDYRQDLLRRIGDRESKYLQEKADIHINRAYQP
jgi:parvulin-like peptidyl-prolyl isomerase